MPKLYRLSPKINRTKKHGLRKFKSAGPFLKKVNTYLDKCEKDDKKPTFPGLAGHLDTTTSVLTELALDPDFKEAFQKLADFLEDFNMQLLYDKNTMGGASKVLEEKHKWRKDDASSDKSIVINFKDPEGGKKVQLEDFIDIQEAEVIEDKPLDKKD